MYIVFGWNHFRIKSFDPYELGLTQKAETDFRVELRQSYFHLFWIPFFGLGKKWAIRKNNQLYEMPAVFKEVITGRSDLKAKSPWYTFTGPLLIVLSILGYNISESVESHRYEKYSQQQFAARYADNAAKFRKPSPDDYYTLVAANGLTRKYARVTGIDKKEVQLTYIIRTDIYAYQPFQIAEAFEKYADETETISIARNDSAKVIINDYDKRESFEGISIKDKYGTARYRIESIARLNGPVFEISSNGYGGKDCWMTIKNQGLETTISKVETLEGTIKWAPEATVPATVSPGKSFGIKGHGDFQGTFKIKLTCTDASGHETHYLWENKDGKKQISRAA